MSVSAKTRHIDSKNMYECACLRGKLRVVYFELPISIKKVSMDFQNIYLGGTCHIKSMDVYISCMFDVNKTLVHGRTGIVIYLRSICDIGFLLNSTRYRLRNIR
jgi:hypothetical protein